MSNTAQITKQEGKCINCGALFSDMQDGQKHAALLNHQVNWTVTWAVPPHDHTAEIAALRAERDAAFAMSRCECATDEACAELAKLRQYLDTAQRRSSALGDEVAGLRADAIRTQNEVVMPLRERVKVLEDALQHVNKCLSINDYGDYVLLSLFDAEIVRTALGDKT